MDRTRLFIQEQGRRSSVSESVLGSFIDMRRRSRADSKLYSVSEATSVIDSREVNNSTDLKQGSSWWSGVLTMANCTIGMGLLNFPKAFSNSGGIFNALIIELVCLIFITTSIWIVGKCCHRYGDVSYQGMVTTFCGKVAGDFTKVLIFLNNFGACVILLMVLGDQFDRVMILVDGPHFCHKWFFSRQFLVPIVATILILPSCILQRFDIFHYTSFIGVLAAVYISFGVAMTRYLTGVGGFKDTVLDTDTLVKDGSDQQMKIFKVIPLVCFAYECHIETPPMLVNLRSRKLSYFMRVAVGYVLLSFTVFSVGAIFGYLTFGDQVTSDLLLSYGSEDLLVHIAMFFICCKIFSTYPILFFCVRTVVDDVWRKYMFSVLSHDLGRRILQTVLLFYGTVAISVFVRTISDVIALIGCLSAFFVFILPGFCFLNLNYSTADRSSLNIFGIFVSLLFIVIGAFLAGAMSTAAVFDFFYNDEIEPLLCE